MMTRRRFFCALAASAVAAGATLPTGLTERHVLTLAELPKHGHDIEPMRVWWSLPDDPRDWQVCPHMVRWYGEEVDA